MPAHAPPDEPDIEIAGTFGMPIDPRFGRHEPMYGDRDAFARFRPRVRQRLRIHPRHRRDLFAGFFEKRDRAIGIGRVVSSMRENSAIIVGDKPSAMRDSQNHAGGGIHLQRLIATCAIVLLLAAASVHAEDTIRCRDALVHVGMIEAEVIAKCGEPVHKDIESVPVRVRRPNGSSGVVGTTQIERWTYDRGPGQFPALLTFEQGKLKSVELLTRR